MSKLTGLANVVEMVHHDLNRATFMYDKISQDPKRNREIPSESLHYWDGKIEALKKVLEGLRKVRHCD